MDTANKSGIDAAKTESKRVAQKTAEATGDLIGNKIADEITLIDKPKEKGTKKKQKTEGIYIPPEKKNKLLMILDYFECSFIEYKFYFLCIKIEFEKNVNFLDITSNNKDLPKFVTKKWIEIYDQSQENFDVIKEIRIKISMLR